MVSGLGRVILILFVITAEMWVINKTLKVLFDIFLTTVVFIPDARPVFSGKMCGTAPSCLKPSATRRGMIFQCNVIVIMLWVCYMCVMNVLWMCYGCVMNVLWECYESAMKVLWMCYGCVMDVWGMLWMCEVCYWCVKDVCMMDEWWIFYIYCVSCIVNCIVIVIL